MPEMMRKDLAAALGVTPATVTRDAEAGMPTHDVEAARRWRQENRRARVAPPPRAGHAQPPEGAVAAGPAQMPADKPADDDGSNYWSHRARREQAEADMAQIKLAEQMGQLVRAADVRAALDRRLAATRESLLQIPARMAPVLAAESDQARVHALIEQELHAALQQIAGS